MSSFSSTSSRSSYVEGSKIAITTPTSDKNDLKVRFERCSAASAAATAALSSIRRAHSAKNNKAGTSSTGASATRPSTSTRLSLPNESIIKPSTSTPSIVAAPPPPPPPPQEKEKEEEEEATVEDEETPEQGELLLVDDTQSKKSLAHHLHVLPTEKELIFYVSTKRGRQLERAILDRVNRDTGYHFVPDKTRQKLDMGEFVLTGEVDGIDAERRCIVEIKTRSRASSGATVSNCERFQVHVYMRMYDCKEALLVECAPDGEPRVHSIHFDARFYHDNLEKLRNKVLEYRDITEEQYVQHLHDVYLNKKQSRTNSIKRQQQQQNN